MLDLFAQLFQHCWGHAYALHMVSKVLWVISFPQNTAGPNIVESCCVRLHVAELPCNGQNLLAYGVQEIHYFHIVHNTLCYLSPPSPQRNPILHNHCFHFFKSVTYSRILQKLKTMFMHFFFRGGGGEKVNYRQFENGEYVSN